MVKYLISEGRITLDNLPPLYSVALDLRLWKCHIVHCASRQMGLLGCIS